MALVTEATVQRLARLAPWLLAGPVTGPLACGCVRYLRAGRWGMACICAAGIVEFWTLGPMLLAWLTSLAHRGG